MNKNNDFTKVIKKIHENKWIALTPDHSKIVAYSTKLASLEKNIGNKKVVYMKVPNSGVKFAF